MKLSNAKLLHSDASPRTLIFMIKFMFAIWFVRYLIDPIQSLSELPVELTSPVSFLGWLPAKVYIAIHSWPGLLLLKLTILASCVAVWIPRYRLRGAAIGCIAIAVINAVTRGFGHINHAEIAPMLVTLILTYFMFRLPRDQVIWPDSRQNSTASVAMVASTLCFALTYSFVGIARLIHGGIELLAGDTITNSMIKMSHHDWLLDYNLSNVLLASPAMLLILKLGTAVVTVFEAAAPFCLVSGRFRKCFLCLIPAFHIGAILVFKINFIENVLTMILFINLTGCLQRQGKSKPLIVPFRQQKSRSLENAF